MENKKRKTAYEFHDPMCKTCGFENNINQIIKMVAKSGNKFTMSYVCEHCNTKALISITRCGFMIMLPYIDTKKKSKVASGWVRQRWYRNSNNNFEDVTNN